MIALYRSKNVVFNSSILFVIAAIIETTLHVCGHFLAAFLTGVKETVLYHNYITYNIDGLSIGNIIFISAAGPNLSLMIALIFHYICYIQKVRNLFSLFSLYMAIFGYIGCFGYVMIAPFYETGDVGYILYVMDFPAWLTFLLAILGAVILFLLMKNLTRYFIEHGTMEIIENPETRVKFIHSIMVYPLLIGILGVALLNLPTSNYLGFIASVASPLVILWTYGFARSKVYSNSYFNLDIRSIDKVDILWVVVLLLIVNLNRLLTNGFFFS